MSARAPATYPVIAPHSPARLAVLCFSGVSVCCSCSSILPPPASVMKQHVRSLKKAVGPCGLGSQDGAVLHSVAPRAERSQSDSAGVAARLEQYSRNPAAASKVGGTTEAQSPQKSCSHSQMGGRHSPCSAAAYAGGGSAGAHYGRCTA